MPFSYLMMIIMNRMKLYEYILTTTKGLDKKSQI